MHIALPPLVMENQNHVITLAKPPVDLFLSAPDATWNSLPADGKEYALLRERVIVIEVMDKINEAIPGIRQSARGCDKDL